MSAAVAPSMDSTPTRLNVKKRKSRGGPEYTPPSGKRLVTDPTRQLLNEFGLQAGAINREFNARLDQDGLERERRHREALEAAAQEHERVRNEAARAQALLETALERERREREQEEQAEIARRQRETVEQQLQREVAQRDREIAEATRLQELRQAALEKARQAAEIRAATPAPVQPQPTPASASPAPTATASVQNNAAPTQSQQSRTSLPTTSTTASTQPKSTQQPGGTSATPAVQAQSSAAVQGQPGAGVRARHQNYVALHKRLKLLRQAAGNLQDKNLKKKTGDYRREIKKSVGQLTTDTKKNNVPFSKIMSVLREAAGLPQPTLNITEYIVQDLPSTVDSSQNTAGVVQTYLLNIFAKAIFAQFVTEAGASPLLAEPIGIIAVRVFAANDFRWQGVSMIDILLAKFHVKCPLLFGSKGATGTGEAMTGIGAGFASLSLRDFGKSTAQNPLPPFNFWSALAYLVNTPQSQINQVHCILLKAMIENHAGKFIKFFGQPAILALRKAVIEFPKLAPPGAATSALSTLAATLKRDLHLTL